MFIILFVLVAAILIVLGCYFMILPEWINKIYNSIITFINSYIHWVATKEEFIFRELYINPATLIYCYLLIGFLVYTYYNLKFIIKWLVPVIALGMLVFFIEFSIGKFKKELWLIHNYTNTIILEIASNKINTYSIKPIDKKNLDYLVSPIKGKLHSKFIQKNTLKNSYVYDDLHISIIETEMILHPEKENQLIILTHSPKINLERIILNHHPKMVIASVHNYKNMVQKWKNTCAKYEVPFYSVSENGSINLAELIPNGL